MDIPCSKTGSHGFQKGEEVSGGQFPQFDEQFKVDAVRLLTESGRPLREVARELGIGRSLLERWRKQLGKMKSPQIAFPGNGNLSAEKKELEEPRRELARVKEEREILKRLWPSSRRP